MQSTTLQKTWLQLDADAIEKAKRLVLSESARLAQADSVTDAELRAIDGLLCEAHPALTVPQRRQKLYELIGLRLQLKTARDNATRHANDVDELNRRRDEVQRDEEDARKRDLKMQMADTLGKRAVADEIRGAIYRRQQIDQELARGALAQKQLAELERAHPELVDKPETASRVT